MGKEPNADLFQFMKGPSHHRTEEEIKFVFDHLGWDYSPLCGAQPPSGARTSGICSCTRFQSFIKPLDLQPVAQRLCIWGQYINQEKYSYKVTKYEN